MIKKIKDAYVVAIKINDSWVAKVGNSKMIADAFDVSEVEDRELQALLCKDSCPDATDCKAMTLQEFKNFRSQIKDSKGKIFTT